jgi:hypothetical protein
MRISRGHPWAAKRGCEAEFYHFQIFLEPLLPPWQTNPSSTHACSYNILLAHKEVRGVKAKEAGNEGDSFISMAASHDTRGSSLDLKGGALMVKLHIISQKRLGVGRMAKITISIIIIQTFFLTISFNFYFFYENYLL